MKSILLLVFIINSISCFACENVKCFSRTDNIILDMDLGGNIKVIDLLEDGADLNNAINTSPNFGAIEISKNGVPSDKLEAKAGYSFIHDGYLSVGSLDLDTYDEDIYSESGMQFSLFYNIETAEGYFNIHGNRFLISECYNI